jgi:hypothetical protein
MTTAPNRRWFRFGEPWGFFEKVNQDATAWTVTLHAILGATFGAVLYGILVYFGGWSLNFWPLKLAAFCSWFAFLYGLSHWQVGNDAIVPPDNERG